MENGATKWAPNSRRCCGRIAAHERATCGDSIGGAGRSGCAAAAASVPVAGDADAAFAFAIWMLVIAAQQIPDNIEALLAAFKNVPTFVCSIAVLGIYWRGYWLWSRRYGLEDSASILISWAMIVTILIFIYPLKAIFGAMWYFISSGQIGQPFSLHTTVSQARTIFAIYALGLIAISAEILLLNLRAWQLREPLRLNARERLMTRGELSGWSIAVGVRRV